MPNQDFHKQVTRHSQRTLWATPPSIAAAALISGALLGLSTTLMVSWLAWACLVPLLLSLRHVKRIWVPAILAGLAYGLVMDDWVFDAVSRYTDHNVGAALLCHGIAVAIMAAKITLLVLLFGPVRKQSSLTQVLFWPPAATLVEMALYTLLEGYPWFQYTVGFSQAKNLYLCQLVELGDVHLLTFAVLVINLLFAACVAQKSPARLALPVACLLALHGYGTLRVLHVEGGQGKTVTVAIANDNATTDLRWNRDRLDEYAARILNLAKTIEDRGQRINIWNEGVMPWTYRTDDDLTRAILATTRTSPNTLHLIGMSSEDNGRFTNSAYLFQKDGTVAGRYDKQNLLKGIEIPALGVKLPFFEASPFAPPAQKHRGIVEAGDARIGILICNEGITHRVAHTFDGTPYDFLVLIANDNWFTGTPLIRHHFYFNRLRAIQSRKDMVINSNLGVSGHISASGAIVHQHETEAPFVGYFKIQKAASGGPAGGQTFEKFAKQVLREIPVVSLVW